MEADSFLERAKREFEAVAANGNVRSNRSVFFNHFYKSDFALVQNEALTCGSFFLGWERVK